MHRPRGFHRHQLSKDFHTVYQILVPYVKIKISPITQSNKRQGSNVVFTQSPQTNLHLIQVLWWLMYVPKNTTLEGKVSEQNLKNESQSN